MGDGGTVVAVDIHPAKTRLIQRAAERLGLATVETVAADASDRDALEDLLFDRGQEKVDLVVLDAPCSGMGTLRRNPELRSREQASVADLARLQDALLDSTSSVLRAGGDLIYAVCTVTAAEGPERVRDFLGRNDSMELMPVTDPVLQPFVEICTSISPAAQVVRTWTDLHGSDSFFMARLRRK
jgi:16S rRNA (cytosine967-C5)-methyltransferase